jgi:hypothetical protein
MHSNHDAQSLIISNFMKWYLNILKVNLLDNLTMSLRKLNLDTCCLY